MTASTAPTKIDHSARLCGCCQQVSTARLGCGCRINIEYEEDVIDGTPQEPFRWCSYHKRCASEDTSLPHAAIYFLDRAADALLASQMATLTRSAWAATEWGAIKRAAEALAVRIEQLLADEED